MNVNDGPVEDERIRPQARLGRGEIDQTTAQVAAWHLANDMSFEQLASKTVRRANGAIVPFFTSANIQAGMQVVRVAVARAEELKKNGSKSDSLSQN